MRQPLFSIRGFADLLVEDYAGQLDDQGLEFLTHITEGTERLAAMIDGVLQIARLQGDAPQREPTDLGARIAAVRGDLNQLLAQADARLTVGDMPTIAADPLMIERVLMNLIANSVRYRSAAPPHITITAERVGSSWIIAVADNGIGIDAADHERVMRPLQRLHRDGDGGVGMGLAICMRIVELHSGQLWLKSALGEGTTVFFSLPDVP